MLTDSKVSATPARLLYLSLSLIYIYTGLHFFATCYYIYIIYFATIVMVFCNDVFVFDFLSVILLLPRTSEYLDLLLRLIL